MNPEEIFKMFEWLSEDFAKLEFADQMRLGIAISEFIDKAKPIYAKYNLSEGGSTFLFKL